MSLIKQLITLTDMGTMLISEIKETVELGKRDQDRQVGELFNDSWRALESLVKQELTPRECLDAINEVITRLDEKAGEKKEPERTNLNRLKDKLKAHMVEGYLLKIVK